MRDELPPRDDLPPLARPAPRPLPWWVRARYRLPARRRLVSSVATLALAGAAGVAVTRTLDEAARRAGELGPTELVAVATHDLEPGAVLQADDVEWRPLPVAGVAAAAVTSTDEPLLGRTVHDPVAAHEPIVRTRLAPAALRGVAAKTPAGRRAMTLAADDHTPPLDEGQVVDLYAVGGDDGAGAGDGRVVARGAIVLQVDERRVTVAVTDDDAPAVAAALIERTVVVAVEGPR